jgi:hypothetical protein
VSLRLASLLTALPDRAVARAFLSDRLSTLGPSVLASELDALIESATRGQTIERAAMIALASWVAHLLATGDTESIPALSAAATNDGRRFAEATFASSQPRKTLASGGKLAEVGMPVFMSLTGIPPFRSSMFESQEAYKSHRAWLLMNRGMQIYAFRFLREAARRHHDPIFVGRLLEQRWMALPDVIRIAARRPSTKAMVLTIATRDRWLKRSEVREALAENPYTPSALALVLLVTARDGLLRVVVHGGHASPEMEVAAQLFLNARASMREITTCSP